MGRQTYGRVSGLVAALLLAVTGCSTGTAGEGDAKPSPPPRTGAPGGTAAQDGTLPGLPTPAQARTRLAGLKMAPQGSMTGYSRDRFPHWAEQGQSCNTREAVLERDGTDVRRDDECRAVSGSWVSVYDGKTYTKASGLDIDHMVPLANAWRSGANTWPQDRRKAFANDLTHPQLLAVSAVSNRSKGDQGPDEWQPPSRAYWCVYARAWTSVKSTYDLTVTKSEKSMLGRMLDTCPA
ncbi:HNH endonuclease family protein [Streptomyces sp. NPDC085481]|uniref:HNH endonuclease family protein n=1 Tax=Streptomyces sp. NPDC085481 TaxID=3365727 RepID=UPI0037CFE1F3